MEQVGEGGSFRQARQTCQARAGIGLLLCLVAGCATAANPRVGPSPLTDRPPTARSEAGVGPYRIGCPDVLEVTAEGAPWLNGRYVVGPDGRIDLGNLGRPRVDGETVTDAAAAIAARASVRPAAVRVAVLSYRSQQVYLVGEVRGLQRAVPYEGPERVVELLQRVGGLTPGAALGDVYLIRPHLTEAKPPEVLRVDVPAIITKHEQATNYIVQPFDQINVGETRPSMLSRSLPPFILPLYDSLFGLRQ
jgi:protein involved in polysaccharide export with SLBB domain